MFHLSLKLQIHHNRWWTIPSFPSRGHQQQPPSATNRDPRNMTANKRSKDPHRLTRWLMVTSSSSSSRSSLHFNCVVQPAYLPGAEPVSRPAKREGGGTLWITTTRAPFCSWERELERENDFERGAKNAIYLKLLTGQSVMQFIHINFSVYVGAAGVVRGQKVLFSLHLLAKVRLGISGGGMLGKGQLEYVCHVKLQSSDWRRRWNLAHSSQLCAKWVQCTVINISKKWVIVTNFGI